MGTIRRAIQLAMKNTTGIEMDMTALKSILCRPECEGEKIVVISMTGKNRIGKSFMLNYMARYLQNWKKDDWMGEAHVELGGFTWKGGAEKVTTDIVTFDRLFSIKLDNGEEVFVMLLDTENLVMLIRNWKNQQQFQFGYTGGAGYWNNVRQVAQNVPENARSSAAIEAAFETIKCFLLPNPGEEVNEDINFNGAIAQLTPRFREHMMEFVVTTLHSAVLQPKQINGQYITCGALFRLCEKYNSLFSSGTFPKLRSITEANAMVQLNILSGKCADVYSQQMKMELERMGVKTIASLETKHETCLALAISKMQEAPIICDESIRETEIDNLRMELENKYAILRVQLEQTIEAEAENNRDSLEYSESEVFSIGSTIPDDILGWTMVRVEQCVVLHIASAVAHNDGMNVEETQTCAINRNAFNRAKAKYIESMKEHFIHENKFDIHKSLADARQLATSYWEENQIGYPNDWSELDHKLSVDLEDLAEQYIKSYDNRKDEFKKIKKKSTGIICAGLCIGPLGLIISTPIALRYEKRKLKKMRQRYD